MHYLRSDSDFNDARYNWQAAQRITKFQQQHFCRLLGMESEEQTTRASKRTTGTTNLKSAGPRVANDRRENALYRRMHTNKTNS